MELYTTSQRAQIPQEAKLALGSPLATPYLLTRHARNVEVILKRNGIMLSPGTRIVEAFPSDEVGQEIRRVKLAPENMPLLHHEDTVLGCVHHHPENPDYQFPVFAKLDGPLLVAEGPGIAAARKGRRRDDRVRRARGRARRLARAFGEDWGALTAERQYLWIRVTEDMSERTGRHGLSDIMTIAVKFARYLEPVELEYPAEPVYRGNENFLSLGKERQWHWYHFAKQAARILPAPLSCRQGPGI